VQLHPGRQGMFPIHMMRETELRVSSMVEPLMYLIMMVSEIRQW